MNPKRTLNPVATGFTLVEVLVVLAILALLMGMLLPSLTGGKQQANKVRARAAINQLCTAARSYHNEYGRWPAPANNAELVLIFNGLRDPITGQLNTTLQDQNPRRIQFLEFTAKDLTAKVGAGNLMFCDPWGTPYGYCFDNGQNGSYFKGPGTSGPTAWKDTTAYDNVIPEPFPSGGTSLKTIDAGCAFVSNGPDTRTGTGLSNPAGGSAQRPVPAYDDDIRSWK